MKTIPPPPPQGTGLHSWIYFAANQARRSGLPAFEAERICVDGALSSGRSARLAHREAREAIRKAYSAGGITPAFGPRHPVPPPPVAKIPVMRDAIAHGPGLADLFEASPVRLETPSARWLFAELMGNEPETLVCIAAQHPAQARTMPLSEALEQVEHSALCVPSPMNATSGQAIGGGRSSRTLDNTGPRRWAVVEFDLHPEHMALAPLGACVEDACSALLWKLHGMTDRLALVCHSGGKSLHGWFKVRDWSEDRIAGLYRAAAILGADMATKCRAQMVRIPDGLRNTGARQSVFYFDWRLL
jgi:hypothetical protein